MSEAGPAFALGMMMIATRVTGLFAVIPCARWTLPIGHR